MDGRKNAMHTISEIYPANGRDDNTLDYNTDDIFMALATFGRVRVRIAEDLDQYWLRDQLNYEAATQGCGLRINSIWGYRDIDAFDISLRKFR